MTAQPAAHHQDQAPSADAACRADVDAVITWVDGNDPAHRERLTKYLVQEGLAPSGSSLPGGARPTRFDAAGEIDFCVRSILRHAPWIRRIHVVCDRQQPQIIAQLQRSEHADRFHLVDHREIFDGFERYLPTFNSRSIISLLWRIDGLAENFIYFNDDMVLLHDVQPGDFFRDNKVVLRGHWQPLSSNGWHRRLWLAIKRLKRQRRDRPGNVIAQELSARTAGSTDRFFRLKHFPYPMRRSTLAQFFDSHPDLLEHNVRYQLRSSTQFKSESVAAHLELLHGAAIVDNQLHLMQLKPRRQSAARIHRALERAAADARIRFLCVQSLDMAPPGVRDEILAWLRQREHDAD